MAIKQKQNNLTLPEQIHLTIVAELGCLVCGRPNQVHHIREGQGMGQRSSHFLTIPLCAEHHTGPMSIHGARQWFQDTHGTELDMLARTIAKIEEVLRGMGCQYHS